jgi:hypothetical protein
MSDTIFGFDTNTIIGFIAILLLITLGVVSFHYYAYIKSTKGLRFGAGFGVGILDKDGGKMDSSMTQ